MTSMTIDDAINNSIIYEKASGEAVDVISVDKRNGLITLRKHVSSYAQGLAPAMYVINEAGLSRYYLLPESNASNDIFEWMLGASDNPIRGGKDICRKCNTKGSENSVRGKIYYYCKNCKDEC